MLMRIGEQERSAAIGQYEFRVLRYPSGDIPREACLQVTIPLLAALWKEIREFQPDYIFCPPCPGDPLAGIHVDHVAVAEAVRKVAYMINVPHAFTPEYPADESRSEPCKTPVIINMHDAYMSGMNLADIAVDVEDAFDTLVQMTWQHQSQIMEWLPWVGRHSMQPPRNIDEWAAGLRARFARRNREMGVDSERVHEFYTVTAWGEVPEAARIQADIPNINAQFSNLAGLEARLNRWRGV